jgi:hypothetical protein
MKPHHAHTSNRLAWGRTFAVVSRGVLCVLFLAAPVLACTDCTACCQSESRCCHLQVSRPAQDQQGLPEQILTWPQNHVSGCCHQPALASDTARTERLTAVEADRLSQTDCRCLLEARDDSPAIPPSSLAEGVTDGLFVCVLPALPPATELGAGSLATALSAHLFHAPTRPLRLLYGVWRD